MQLFNQKTINRHIAHAPMPDLEKVEILRQWGETIRDQSILTQKETALHGNFKQRIICEVLGYRDFNDSGQWTVDVEAQIGAGSVDLALGQFSRGLSNIIAPFELKGAKTKNLDAIMPGRAKSPVQQAWDYASDNVGSKWVLVSNYTEIRLYSYADGRQFYDSFNLEKLHDPAEYQRFMLLLSAENLLGGRTLDILAESRKEDRDITARLYGDYRKLRSDLIGAVQSTIPDCEPLEAIRLGQMILDRVLFIAFAEDNGLLPDDSLLRAFEHSDPYHPKPVWQNFLGLFAAIDKGNGALKIPRYNGGLFKPNADIIAMAMPDHICEGFKALAEYDFASEISVTVLGHIFEQSIADVEILQAEALGETPLEKKASGTSGRRKRDGVVYTPDYVARFIVDQTLGAHCREIFDGVLAVYAVKGANADDDPIKWKPKKAEKQAWQIYRDKITSLRIVDPACGSGVFLIMAFDWLKEEITRCNIRLEALGEAALFEPDSEILTNNLFGVDVNSESVEIAKLSLWIKTARRGKVLDSLDGNLRVGDSLIEDSSFAYRDHGFVWKEAFPEIFADGGFDVVLGNPPYVRQELLKELKPYLQKRFAVYHGVADLYAYFFERGLRLLKPGGRLGYISSSTFFKTGSGAPLRDYLRSHATLENIVDFGDHQIFDGVTTYPAIITMRVGEPGEKHNLQFWTIDQMPTGSFADTFAEAAETYPQSALGSGSWELENPALRALRQKIVKDKPTLKEVYGSPLYGIKTGRNEAFVIDRTTRDRLIAEDPKSAEILKPWIDGAAVQRWRDEDKGLFVILFPKGWTNANFSIDGDMDIEATVAAKYPKIFEHLRPYAESASRRSDKGDYWWELRACAYYDRMSQPKILYRDIASAPTFFIERSGKINDTTSYFIPQNDPYLLSLVNSKLLWFILLNQTTKARGGYYRFKAQYIEPLPIPPATDAQKAELGKLAEATQAAAEKRYSLQQEITRRIPDLATDPANAKLTNKLKDWWKLPDFAAFQKEIKKALKVEIPLKNRNEWEKYISEKREDINALTAEITRLEQDINTKVYKLFDLNQDEIELLEANI